MPTPPLTLVDRLPLQTRRLALRRLTLADADGLAAMLADAEVMRHFPRTMARHESDAWLRRNLERYARDGTGLFAVSRDGAWIGDCGLVLRHLDDLPVLELGYHFQRAVWGHGYAREAAAACVALARSAAFAVPLLALIRPANVRSRRVVAGLGFRPRGVVLHAGVVHERWVAPPAMEAPERP